MFDLADLIVRLAKIEATLEKYQPILDKLLLLAEEELGIKPEAPPAPPAPPAA